MPTQSANAFIEAIKAEHRDLGARVHAIQNLLEEEFPAAETPFAAARLAELLDDLRERLDRHFDQEEKGGFLEEALVHAPQMSGDAQRLMDEHPELLRATTDLVAKALACHTAAAWPGLREAASILLKRLRQHEAGENRVLLSGFNIDPEIIE
jgi:iron-sulfur cluster repair protein YtfE (RIC family)